MWLVIPVFAAMWFGVGLMWGASPTEAVLEAAVVMAAASVVGYICLHSIQ
jgi:hypothetical protein